MKLNEDMHDDRFVLNWSDERVICVSFNMYFVMFPKGYLQNKINPPKYLKLQKSEKKEEGFL